jgi:hypothetical protein
LVHANFMMQSWQQQRQPLVAIHKVQCDCFRDGVGVAECAALAAAPKDPVLLRQACGRCTDEVSRSEQI